MNKYGLFTSFKTQPGKRDEFALILLQASQLMSIAKGCHHYIIYKDNQDGNCICVSEIWDSKEDHDNSLKIEGCMELISKAFPLMNGKPESKTFEVLGGKGIADGLAALVG